MLGDFIDLFRNEIFLDALRFIWLTWSIWSPILVVYGSLHLWLKYKQIEWIRDQGSFLLEIKLPNEMLKSPALMESFFQSLHQPGVGTISDTYFKGRVRSWFSFELVSREGQVHFYAWTNSRFKKLVETQLYALFPNIEVHEVPDYILDFRFDPAKYKYSKLTNIVLTKDDAYPIKSYIDYGLDKDPKEEFKNDPITPVLEFLGSLKKGEHAWIQILIQANAKENLKYGRLFTKPEWKKRAEAEIKKIASAPKFAKPADEKGMDPKYFSEEQKDLIKSIERSMEKSAFDTMIRAFYFAEKDAANSNNIGGLLSVFKQFSSNTYNGFKPGWGADYDFPWQDFKGMRQRSNEKKMFEAYRRRSYFNPPFKHFKDKPYVLTTEELATIWHFPSSMVAATPTLNRIPSKKAEAPANLPV